MRKVCWLLVIIGFIFTLQSCGVYEKKLQESGAKLLSQNELVQLFNSPQTARFVTPKGYTGTLRYFPNGKQTVEYSDGNDEGKYRIENGMLCSKWKEIRNGREKCVKIYKVGDKKYEGVTADGSRDATLIFK